MLKLSAAAPSLARATEVVTQSALVIENFARARDGLYLRLLDGGISRLKRLRRGKLTEIRLPFDGTLSALNADAAHDGALLSVTGWLAPAGVWP